MEKKAAAGEPAPEADADAGPGWRGAGAQAPDSAAGSEPGSGPCDRPQGLRSGLVTHIPTEAEEGRAATRRDRAAERAAERVRGRMDGRRERFDSTQYREKVILYAADSSSFHDAVTRSLVQVGVSLSSVESILNDVEVGKI